MVNYNGDLLPSGSQFLNQENRGIRFGDALLEEVKYNGKGLLFWEDHYFRLMASMRRLRMEIPMEFTMEYLEEQIRKTLKAANLEDHAVLVHLVICRKPGGDWVPEDRGVDYSIGLTELRDSEYILETAGNRAD